VDGAVVVRCEVGWAGARAGLRSGDVVSAWKRAGLHGSVDSFLDLARVEQDQAPLGPVVLEVWRGRRVRHLTMPRDSWKVDARPTLSPADLARHSSALRFAVEGALDPAVSTWRTLAEKLNRRDRPIAAAWCAFRAASAFIDAGREKDALAKLEAAAALITDPVIQALLWERGGNAFLESGHRKPASTAFTKAIELRATANGESPAVAFTLLQLCRTAHRQHEVEAQKALGIYRALQDDGIQAAEAAFELALSMYASSRYDRAEALCREALAIVERRAPESPLRADLLGRLGLAVLHLGDLEAAQTLFTRELRAAERIDPDGPRAGHACNRLGLVAKRLGEYQVARSWYLRGLEIYRSCRPDGVEVAGMLNNLGNIAIRENDFATALRYHRQALAIRERLHPGGRDVATSLNNLGLIERQLGHYDTAGEYLERALALKRVLAPGTLTLSNTLTELDMVAARQQRLEEARRLYEKALTIRQRVAPDSPGVADVLFLQGALAMTEERPRSAERLWRRATSIVERTQEGLRLSADARSRFGARYYLFYGALARLLATEGRAEEGFALMERARSRALRAMLLGSQSIPAGVSGRLWAAYRRSLERIDRLRAELARRGESDPATGRGPSLVEELQRLEKERNRMAGEIRAEAPRLAGLSRVAAPTLDQVCRALDPGTVMLSYVIGEEDSVLFVAQPATDVTDCLRTSLIPVGAEEIENRIEIFRTFISRGRTTTEADPALVTQGRRLFDLLLAPAMADIESARRVLIVPDGPLRDLPFAALALPGEPLRYLGAWKPLFMNPSGGAFVALKSRRERSGSAGLVAFADPEYGRPPRASGDPRLPRLSGSRDEARAIAAALGGGARTFLGGEATEARFRAVSGEARYLHLAVHALPDTRFPMKSALFFSTPPFAAPSPNADGVLHAWEIMDRVQCRADVVTLSACSTATGEQVAGEGVLGLARAFQYAGARTVVASQWPVGDRATAELMVRFYQGLKDGLSTADALRSARQALAASPIRLAGGETLDARHPFNWAAFQVMGDWK